MSVSIPWAMCGTPYDELRDPLIYPVMVQPKLDGVRAKWNGFQLVSRQRELFKQETMPHIYEQLSAWSTKYPDVILDGELYSHGMPLQEINRRVAINRQLPHDDVKSVHYHAFDLINDEDTETRQLTLSQIYPLWVPVGRANNEGELFSLLDKFVEAGYEGLMARAYNVPYLVGRTEALVKLKPWQYARVKIVGFSPGKDKYSGMLGAFIVMLDRLVFNVSGGLTDVEREAIMKHQGDYIGRSIMIRYRDKYNSGIPSHPQIQRMKV